MIDLVNMKRMETQPGVDPFMPRSSRRRYTTRLMNRSTRRSS